MDTLNKGESLNTIITHNNKILRSHKNNFKEEIKLFKLMRELKGTHGRLESEEPMFPVIGIFISSSPFGPHYAAT